MQEKESIVYVRCMLGADRNSSPLTSLAGITGQSLMMIDSDFRDGIFNKHQAPMKDSNTLLHFKNTCNKYLF